MSSPLTPPPERVRTLAVGDRIASNPCVVTITKVGGGGAWGRCSTCESLHVIDRGRYEAGGRPWAPRDASIEAPA